MAPSKKRKAAAIAEAEPAAVATPPSKRGRGRPSKAEKAENEPTQAVATPPVKRGRPTKATNSAISNSGLVQNNNPTPSKASNKGQAAKANTSLRRSSRHPSGADTVANPETAAIASRVTRGSNAAATNGTVVAVKGTKAKGKAKAASSSKAGAGATKVSTRGLAKKKPVAGKGKAAATTELNGNDKDSPSNNEDLPTVEQPTKRRGRKAQVSVNVSSRIGAAEEAEDADEEDVDQPNYWLMKAEPESRIEKGKDVKFSIDDLKNAFEPEGWDGVRNPTARNNMRSMMKGDQAFFYHSNCKVPGVAGIMEVVEEHTPDESALDHEHPYYDPKSTADNPRWCKVRVSFRRKFPELVKLKELQKYAKEGGVLQKLQTLKQARLSVSRVSKKEWDFILRLAGEEDEAEGQADVEDDNEATASTKAGQPDVNTFAGENGVADADSALTAVWTGVSGANGVSSKGVPAET